MPGYTPNNLFPHIEANLSEIQDPLRDFQNRVDLALISVDILRGSAQFQASPTCAVAVDLSGFGAYFVLIAKTEDEHYWVGELDKTPAGFTVHSSNPASTAWIGWGVLAVPPYGPFMLEDGTGLLLEDGTALLLEG